MTRINLVDPKLLVRQHLIAEYRELPRIYALVRQAVARGECPANVRFMTTEKYTLGAGHCRFFYPRLGWLTDRYHTIVAEMLARGHQVSHRTIPDWANQIPQEWHGQWQPSSACVAINVERINLRLVGMGMAEHQIQL